MPKVEWAVIEPVFRGTKIVKGGLGSREEAELWRAALELTRKRTDREWFMATDSSIASYPLAIAWRLVDPWHGPDEEPPT